MVREILKSGMVKLMPNRLQSLIRRRHLLGMRLVGSLKFIFRNRAGDPPRELVKPLKNLNAHFRAHSERSFLTHLLGTYRLLREWDAPEYVCVAGLYHSIYGTQTFRESSIPIEQREILQSHIGTEAEKLVYYFCIRDEKHFWSNLQQSNSFKIRDRLHDLDISIIEKEFRDLLEICLADHLEQMYYYSYPYWLKKQFLKAEPFLSSQGCQAFLRAYQKVL